MLLLLLLFLCWLIVLRRGWLLDSPVLHVTMPLLQHYRLVMRVRLLHLETICNRLLRIDSVSSRHSERDGETVVVVAICGSGRRGIGPIPRLMLVVQ